MMMTTDGVPLKLRLYRIKEGNVSDQNFLYASINNLRNTRMKDLFLTSNEKIRKRNIMRKVRLLCSLLEVDEKEFWELSYEEVVMLADWVMSEKPEVRWGIFSVLASPFM